MNTCVSYTADRYSSQDLQLVIVQEPAICKASVGKEKGKVFN